MLKSQEGLNLVNKTQLSAHLKSVSSGLSEAEIHGISSGVVDAFGL